MPGNLMILAGALLIIGSIAAGFYQISIKCSQADPSGCEESVVDLISALMIANEGIFFWLAWVAGIFLIWGGMRAKG